MSERDERGLKPADSAADSLREKLTLAVVGFILTGVVGGMVTTWIQQRGWAWQNRVSTIEKDVGNAVAAYKATSELLNMRWHSAYRLVRTLEREEKDAAWQSARTDFAAADREWALHYANVVRDVEFYVDAPFGISGSEDIKKVWSYVCEGGTKKATIDTQSARALLELVNHCQSQLETGLEAIVEPAPDAPRMDAKQRKAAIDRAYLRLDQIYRTNDALRCVMFDRAVAIRGALTSQSYWSAFFGVQPPTYKIGRKIEDCF